jgi:ATP-binding cassette subfamily G (WHITE) protein 2 (SNQ2)
VTDPLGRIPRSPAPAAPVPRTASEFAAAFTHSALGAANRDDIAAFRNQRCTEDARTVAFREGAVAEHAKHTRDLSAYITSVPMQVRAVMVRRVQILRGNPVAQIIQTMSFVVNGIILGTTFLKEPEATSAYFSRGGIIFLCVFSRH